MPPETMRSGFRPDEKQQPVQAEEVIAAGLDGLILSI
jgi:hypothetical protein